MNTEKDFDDYCHCRYLQLLGALEIANEAREKGNSNYDQQIALIHNTIQGLREEVLAISFCDPKDEIHFMKKILPDFLALMIYFSEKADWESARFISSDPVRKEFVDRKLKRAEIFFTENAEFIRYYHSGSSHLDEHYFLRAHTQLHRPGALLNEWTDLAFCTAYSHKVATLIAYARLDEDIKPILAMVSTTAVPPTGDGINLKWTDSKTGLLELIYSLKEQGAFNHGNADIKTIADHFARFFSVDLGNTSSAFQKMLLRKTSRTLYIDELKERLLAKIRQLELQQRKQN